MRVLAITLLLLWVATPAYSRGNAMTGSSLLEACLIPDESWIGFCHGYMQAVVDATDGEISCVSASETRATITNKAVRGLRDVARLHDLNAFAATHAILRRLYPCNN